MSEEPDEELLEEYFLQLRKEYLVEAPARLGELRKDLAAIRAGEPEALDSLKSRFHKLAGSGGSYGFPAITEVSREAEDWLGEHPHPDDSGFAYLGAAIGRVAAAFDFAARELGFPAAPQKPPPFGWRATLLGGATDLAARLTVALRDARYAVSTGPLDSDPALIPASERPEIVVAIPGPGEDPTECVARWSAGPFERYLAVALVAEPGSLDLLRPPFARLDLFVEPARADSEIARWARGVARLTASPPSAVLVLSDDAERSQVTTWLEAAGVRVTAVRSATAALELLRKEIPDLVLLDWALPEAQTTALVRLLRRTARFVLTPVVALTSMDTDLERERALAAGVDELVVRPLGQGRLVPSVLHRAARARRLEEVVRRDALTGFLTVGALADELEIVLAYARRGKEQLCFLLLDVDHFRRVNEQLGHETGDQILAHLARVIRERVRASDLVVRMGGEEFGVLFRRCTVTDALMVADEIRRSIEAAPPIVEGTPMPVRLSGGIAAYPDHAVGMRELVLAAERALRVAKETGRDRVVVTGEQ
jgi:diguanylate cyclase (GGDEF)-like protein